MNELYLKRGDELALILAAIRVPYLSLEQNVLYKIDDLITSMAKVNPSVIRLNISGNGFTNKEFKQQTTLLAAFPSTITDLDISYNFNLSTMTQFSTFLKSIPLSINTLRWEDLLYQEITSLTYQKLHALTNTSISTLDFGEPFLKDISTAELERLANLIFKTGKEILIKGPLKELIGERQKELRSAIQAGLFAVRQNSILDKDTTEIIFSYIPT